jgi:hypothetical protein
MTSRARMLVFKGQVSHRHEADRLLTEPGATVLIHRGVPRSLAIACPDGCGEQLTVNLDERAGPAWRHYQDGKRLTIFPSVWRDTGCKSHFIVWRSKIYWCDWNEELDTPEDELLAQVRRMLTDQFASYVTLADALGQVPWAVLSACNRLASQGVAVRGQGKLHGQFRRKNP